MWVLQRPGTLAPEEKPRAAPPLLEFDAAGTFVQAWGGPGEGYDWPNSEHGVYVDPKGFVWIGGNGENDHQILKFTKAGKFVMQIGGAGKSTGNADTRNLNQPADTFVYARTNELFVADGYGNRRVIVFDADTGAFKRMWGAFGNAPTDGAPDLAQADIGAERFAAVHPAGARRPGVERRPRLRVRSRRQARPGVHHRRKVRVAGVHRPRLPRARLRERHDGREHRLFRRTRRSASSTSAIAARRR